MSLYENTNRPFRILPMRIMVLVHQAHLVMKPRLTMLLSSEGADSWILGQIYSALVQSVMIYRLRTWVMTPIIRRVLGVFNHRVACRLTEG